MDFEKAPFIGAFFCERSTTKIVLREILPLQKPSKYHRQSSRGFVIDNVSLNTTLCTVQIHLRGCVQDQVLAKN